MNIYQDEAPQSQSKQVNPWKTIWYRPRAAIRSVMDNQTIMFPIFLAILSGVVSVINQAVGDDLGEDVPLIIITLMAIIGGPIVGVVGITISAGIFTLVGKIFKGRATFSEMMMALGAAYIPYAVMFVVTLSNLLLIRGKLFYDVEFTVFETLWFVLTVLVIVIMSLWSVFLTIKAVAEAHQFSSWKALFTFLIIVVVIIILFTIFLLALLAIFAVFV